MRRELVNLCGNENGIGIESGFGFAVEAMNGLNIGLYNGRINGNKNGDRSTLTGKLGKSALLKYPFSGRQNGRNLMAVSEGHLN